LQGSAVACAAPQAGKTMHHTHDAGYYTQRPAPVFYEHRSDRRRVILRTRKNTQTKRLETRNENEAMGFEVD
jgi:hypothetical protein